MDNQYNKILKRIKKEIRYFLNTKYRNFIIKKWVYYNVLYKIFRKKYDLNLKIGEISLTVPNSPQSFGVIEEVFIEDTYSQLHNLNCILDLGAFLGESSIYLIKNKNKKVIAVEADPDNYKYLIKNVKKFNNIIPYNLAVSITKGRLRFSKNDEFDLGTNSKKLFKKYKITFEIDSIPISELIEKYNPDGIKMDIEGGEFEIMKWFINNPKKFNFNKGYFEIHFEGKNETNITIFKKFIEFLENMGYHYDIYINKDRLSLTQLLQIYNDLKDKEWLMFHLYFKKIQPKVKP